MNWVDFLLGLILLAFIPAFVVLLGVGAVFAYGWWGILLPTAVVGLAGADLYLMADEWRGRYR